MQVPASWGLPGLDEETAERLYAKVKAQTRAGPQPEEIKGTYASEWLEAAELAGSPIVDEPKVHGAATLCPGPLHATCRAVRALLFRHMLLISLLVAEKRSMSI